MRTNIVINDSLIKEAMQLSGIKTKKDVIATALQEFVQNKKRRNILDLAGKITFCENYDHKTLREGK